MTETGIRVENPQSFEPQAERVISAVRDAFAELIAALPGVQRRASELRDTLGIDGQLAWKVFKVVHDSDPFAAARHIPGSVGVQKFLKAAARRRLRPQLIESARGALADFERLIQAHAGDRTSFEMMLSSYAREDREPNDLPYRLAAFRGLSYMVGVQARVHLKAFFLQPGATPGLLDVAAIRGFIALRRLRANVPWMISRGHYTDNDGEARRTIQREPLDASDNAADSSAGVPLLREFCSKPLPKFRRVPQPPAFVEDQLVDGPVGDTAAVTCITGEVARCAASCFRDEHNRFGELVAHVGTPCEVLLFDQFVRKDVYGPLKPELVVYSELGGLPPYPAGTRDRDQLCINQRVQHLGRGPSVVHSPNVPCYAEMVRYVFDRLGWHGELFDVYRIRLQYPFIPTTVVMRHELPERPTQADNPQP